MKFSRKYSETKYMVQQKFQEKTLMANKIKKSNDRTGRRIFLFLILNS